jgi:type VI protein secretion system component VasF
MKSYHVPEEQRLEFNQVLDRLHTQVQMLDDRAPSFYHYCQHSQPMLDDLKKLIGIVRFSLHVLSTLKLMFIPDRMHASSTQSHSVPSASVYS